MGEICWVVFHLKKLFQLILTGHASWVFYRLRRFLRSLLVVESSLQAPRLLSPEQVSAALHELNQSFQVSGQRALCIHLYYTDVLQEILASPLVRNKPVDLHISLGPNVDAEFFKNLSPYKGCVFIYQFSNQGRDVYPFLKIYPQLLNCGYAWVCKLHSKRSPQIRDGELWRKDLFKDLLSLEMAEAVESASSAKVLFAAENSVLPVGPFLGTNGPRMRELLSLMDLAVSDLDFMFVAGTMFWFRTEALRPLLKLDSVDDLFEEESPTIDGLTAHAFERLFHFICFNGPK